MSFLKLKESFLEAFLLFLLILIVHFTVTATDPRASRQSEHAQ